MSKRNAYWLTSNPKKRKRKIQMIKKYSFLPTKARTKQCNTQLAYAGQQAISNTQKQVSLSGEKSGNISKTLWNLTTSDQRFHL